MWFHHADHLAKQKMSLTIVQLTLNNFSLTLSPELLALF